MTDGYGIFNTHTTLGASRTHKGGPSGFRRFRRTEKLSGPGCPPCLGSRTQGLRLEVCVLSPQCYISPPPLPTKGLIDLMLHDRESPALQITETVKGLIDLMLHDRESPALQITDIRQATGNYTPPPPSLSDLLSDTATTHRSTLCLTLSLQNHS